MRSERALPPPKADGYFVWVRGGITGDDLIRRASLQFLRDSGLDIWESDGQIESAALQGDDGYLSEALGAFTGLLFFNGGGNIGLCRDNGYVRTRVAASARSARGLLVLPQSARSADAGLKSERFVVWARERATFDVLTRAGVRTELVPDAAFYLDPTIPKISGGSGMFQVLRHPGKDDERTEHGLLIAGAVRGDPTSDLDLQTIIGLLAPYRTIVSDRLHGAIIALMLRKRTALLPTRYHKIRSFYETWLNNDPGAAYVEDAQALEQFVNGSEPPRLDLGALFATYATPALRAFLNQTSRRSARVEGDPSLVGRSRRQRLVSITCVRNESDIVEAFVRHTLAFVDEMVILDHDSTDDTSKIVKALQDEGLALTLLSDQTVGYWQWLRMTRLMREAVQRCGADWVLPLDADEFIVEKQPGCLRRVLDGAAGPVHVRWTTYVPRSTDDPHDSNPVTRIRCRVSEEPTWYKVIVPRYLAEQDGATLIMGSHDLKLDGVSCAASPTSQISLAHFPIRSSSQFAGKVAITHLQMLAMHSENSGYGFHVRRFYDLLKTNPEQFRHSYYDAALEYVPCESLSQAPTAIEERLSYAGGWLRHTPASEPLFPQMLLQYAERLAQSYATSSGELEVHKKQAEEFARERTEWETERRDRERRERSAGQEPAQTIPAQDSQSVHRELTSVQQQLSHTQKQLGDARQALTSVRSREKSLVGELSLAISSLQQLRDRVHERDRSLTAINQKSRSTEKELKSLRKGEGVARERLQHVKERLRSRDQELADLRERKLVRMAITLGNLIHRYTSASALWRRFGWARR